MQPELFTLPSQPPNRLTKLERKAVYHAIRFYLYQEPEDRLDGKLLPAVYSAMNKLKPRRKIHHANQN